MQQLSLFPDGFELQEQALHALRELDVGRAAAMIERARSAGVNTTNVEAIAAAIAWLRRRMDRLPDAGLGASLLRAIGPAALTAELPVAAAAFADQAVARFLAGNRLSSQPFVDAECTLPGAVVSLVLGDAASAHAALGALLSQHQGRADLWGWFGDAALLVGRPDEADAAYVRALLIAPDAIDLWRCRHAGLQELLAGLRRRHPLATARELLLAEAWIQGILAIPAGNRWLEPARVASLLASASATADSPAPARFRRFARLLYADRTAGSSGVDLLRREEMQALSPELFARFVEQCGAAKPRAGSGHAVRGQEGRTNHHPPP